jgi:hypothetical protein
MPKNCRMIKTKGREEELERMEEKREILEE